MDPDAESNVASPLLRGLREGKPRWDDDQLVGGLPGDERSYLTRLRPGHLQRAFNIFKLHGSESPDSSWEDNPSTPSRVLGLSSSMMRGPSINRLGRDFDFRSSGTLAQRTRCQNPCTDDGDGDDKRATPIRIPQSRLPTYGRSLVLRRAPDDDIRFPASTGLTIQGKKPAQVDGDDSIMEKWGREASMTLDCGLSIRW